MIFLVTAEARCAVSARSLPRFLSGYEEVWRVSLARFTGRDRGGMRAAAWPLRAVSGFCEMHQRSPVSLLG